MNAVCLHIALGIVGSGHVPKEVSSSSTEILGEAILLLSKLYMYTIYAISTLLCMIHTSLALGNSTTFEMTKGSEHIDYLTGTSMMDFPFGRGLFSNMRMFASRDDIFSWMQWCVKEGGRDRPGRLGPCCKVADKSKSLPERNLWVPILWKMPDFIERESDDWWNHPWQNKYWSCC